MHLDVFLTSCLLKLKAMWEYVTYLNDGFFFTVLFCFVWLLVVSKDYVIEVIENHLILMKYTLFQQ